MKWLLLFQLVTKIDPSILKIDRCHYIILGATQQKASSLYASGRTNCVKDWHSFAKPEAHFAALRLYMKEVKETWPEDKRDWQLKADLEQIEREDINEAIHRSR